MTVGFVPLYDLSNDTGILKNTWQNLYVLHLIFDSNISPRAKGQRPDIG